MIHPSVQQRFSYITVPFLSISSTLCKIVSRFTGYTFPLVNFFISQVKLTSQQLFSGSVGGKLSCWTRDRDTGGVTVSIEIGIITG